MLETVRAGLAVAYPQRLVDELLAAYVEAKGAFYEGGLRLSAVEGGRFSEAAFRMLQHRTTGSFVPLGETLKTDPIIKALANLPGGSHPDSIRLHIPRALRVVYDIRNNRDTAHLGDNIDPNMQDATLVMATLDWVLAEFVRLDHKVTAEEASAIVERIVARRAPSVQDFAGFLKVLRTDLKAADFVLLLLYERGSKGASFAELEKWVRPPMRANLRRTLHRLEHDTAFVHQDGGRYFITKSGVIHAEERKLHQPPT